jgi:hypothetical protein
MGVGEEFIDDPAQVGLRDVFEHVDADHPIELSCRELTEGFIARIIGASLRVLLFR